MSDRLLTALLFMFVGIQTASADRLQISVTEVEASVSATQNRGQYLLRLDVLMKIQNTSDTEFDLKNLSAELTADETPLRNITSGDDQFANVRLAPSQSVTQKPRFELPVYPQSVPDLQLQIRSADQQTDIRTVDITAVLQEQCAFPTELIGPRNCLALIQVQRSLDAASIWFLAPRLQKLHADGIRRIILAAEEPEQKFAISLAVRQWLKYSMENSRQPAGLFSPFAPLPADFRSLMISGSTAAFFPGSSTQTEPQFTDNPEEAIRASLLDVYRILPVSEAIADLRHPNSAVRRAALAGIADSLSFDDAAPLLQGISADNTAARMDIASVLQRLPGRRAVQALAEMALDENSEIAAVAMKSLAASQDHYSPQAVNELWLEGHHSPHLRQTLAEAMVKSGNENWIPFLEDFVREFLEAAVSAKSGGYEPASLESALQFLQQSGAGSMVEEVRSAISSVNSSEVFDVLARHLLQLPEQTPEDQRLLRELFGRKIASGQITATVQLAAIRLKPAEWTTDLLDHHLRRKEIPRATSRFDAVLACASRSQLLMIAEKTEQLDSEEQAMLIQAMITDQLPAWRTIAEQLLQREPDRYSIGVIEELGRDASESSIAVLQAALKHRIQTLEGTREASVYGQQYLQQLLTHLSGFAHPECRRMINQCCRDANSWVAELARTARQQARSRSPAFRALIEEYQLRQSGDNDGAQSALETALRLDPYLVDSWVRRSSTRMHAGNFESAMQDLKKADTLSPENPEVLSMTALVNIRLGNVQEGLAATDALIAEMPDDDYALYNGACTYSRAAEQDGTSAADRESWRDRAIQLLEQTNATGFNDHEHLVKDPDLISLHVHPRWDAVVAAARGNADKKNEDNE